MQYEIYVACCCFYNEDNNNKGLGKQQEFNKLSTFQNKNNQQNVTNICFVDCLLKFCLLFTPFIYRT